MTWFSLDKILVPFSPAPFSINFSYVSIFFHNFCVSPSSVSSPLFCLPPPFTSSRLSPASLPHLLPHTGAGPGCAGGSRAGRAGGGLGFSLEAQECVESGGTKGAGHRKNGASVGAGEVSQILRSAEWSTWGAGRGGNSGGGGGHRWCTGSGQGTGRRQWELLASVGISGESSARRGDCLPPCSGLPWETGLGSQEYCTSHTSRAAGGLGWPPRRQEWWGGSCLRRVNPWGSHPVTAFH